MPPAVPAAEREGSYEKENCTAAWRGHCISHDYGRLRGAERHIFRICGLTDDYGSSGKVGLLLLEEEDEALKLKLLIVSCRVMTRGIGSALLCYATQLAARKGKKLQAEFLETEHNRIMYITYKLAGFEEIWEDEPNLLLEYQGEAPLDFPPYLTVTEA